MQEEVIDLIADVLEMDKIAKRKDEEGNVAKSLSGGEKKRIDLIRSLSKEADIYIFDEPTNELDKLNIEKVLNEFSALKNKQKMVIVISHDKRLQTIADEIIEI